MASENHRGARAPSYAFLFVGAVACAAYFALPDTAQSILYDVIGLAGVAAIIVGTALHRPHRAIAWYLLAVGQLMWVLGDMVWTYDELVLHRESPFPSIADVSYLGGYIPTTIGLAILVTLRRTGRDIVTLIDTAMVTVVAGVASWIFIIEPITRDASGLTLDAVISVAYPVADIVLIALMASLLLTVDRHNPSLRLLIGGLIASIVADTLYVPGTLQGWYQSGHVIDAGWLTNYVLWGAAALHPSMERLTYRADRVAMSRMTRNGLLLQAVLVAALPAAWVVTNDRRSALGSAVLLAGPTAFSLLILARMARLRVDLAHEGTHDPLTGLPNRRLLFDRIAEMSRRVRRRKQPMAVFYVDLGGFKRVNDRFGHEAGDEALVEIARRLRGVLRGSDTVARLGGDEFVVLCENTDETLAAVLAERLRSAISAPIEHAGIAIELDAHIGVVIEHGMDELNIGQILADADRAMYAAKGVAGP